MDDRSDFEPAAGFPPSEPPAFPPNAGPDPDLEPLVQPPAPAAPVLTAQPVPAPAHVRPPRGRASFGALLAAALIGGLIGAAAVGGTLWSLDRAAPAPVAPVVAQAPVPARLTIPTQPLEAVAAKVVPSVVNIAVESRDVFGTSSAVGSGVIIRADGYILTNNHVVEGATKIVVRLGTIDMTATVVGTDPTSDLAVIKIAKTGLPAATLGSSADLQVGEEVIAVGSPFGLDKTVTSGIVSALHRANLTQGQSGLTSYTNLIQTDASINPGNSGGALADLSGAVVGINTLILSPSGQLGQSQSAGIGFAIPIDFAKGIADQLVAGKKITHPYLGVSTASVDQAIAQYYDLPVSSGALIQQVSTGSPAEAAGLKVGDIIVRMGGTAIGSSEDVFTAVRAAAIGQKISVEVARGSRTMTMDVTLGSDASAR
ncbi:MAG TPA: trypsin-like peptidase domain-containing protein [Coriobacteriia bacterium]